MLEAYRLSRAVKCCRVTLSLLLILLVVSSAAGQRRKRVEISSFMQPSPVAARRYFRVHGRFGGGVAPRGSAQFLSPTRTTLAANELQLVVLNWAKFRNNQPDYDAVGIRWKGQVYQLAAQDNLIYPLMKFIERDNYLAYTIPLIAFDEKYFRDNGLVVEDGGGGYVAQEFRRADLTNFLGLVDVETETESLEARFKRAIMGNAKVDRRAAESYVNADFHVKYQVFLGSANGKRVVDVGGLPLRYFYRGAVNDSTKIVDVEVFEFPEVEYSLQDRAVMFFQTAAILRQFRANNRAEFNRFMNEVKPPAGGSQN